MLSNLKQNSKNEEPTEPKVVPTKSEKSSNESREKAKEISGNFPPAHFPFPPALTSNVPLSTLSISPRKDRKQRKRKNEQGVGNPFDSPEIAEKRERERENQANKAGSSPSIPPESKQNQPKARRKEESNNSSGLPNHSLANGICDLNAFQVEESNGKFILKVKGDARNQTQPFLVIKTPVNPSKSSNVNTGKAPIPREGAPKREEVVQMNPILKGKAEYGSAPPIPVIGDPIFIPPSSYPRYSRNTLPDPSNSRFMNPQPPYGSPPNPNRNQFNMPSSPIPVMNSNSYQTQQFSNSPPMQNMQNLQNGRSNNPMPNMMQNNENPYPPSNSFNFYNTAPSQSNPTSQLYSSRSQASQNILKQWFKDHINCPYPSEEEMILLSKATGFPTGHINQWFATTRTMLKQVGMPGTTPLNSTAH